VAIVILAAVLTHNSSVSASNSLEPLSTGGDGMMKRLEAASHQTLNKRSIYDPTCKGLFSKEIFQRLNRVCKDCYAILYRDHPEVEGDCKRNCFSGDQFLLCVAALQKDTEEHNALQQYIFELY